MNLTDLQLDIMKLWASKELSFGCICEFVTKQYYDKYIVMYQWISWKEKIFAEYISLEKDMNWFYDTDWGFEIIWHPITRWRLCYLRRKLMEINKNITDIKTIAKEVFSKEERVNKARMCIDSYFFGNPSLYNQTILERPEELQLLIKDFLISIQ